MANLQILSTLGGAAAVHPLPPLSTTPTDDSDATSKLKQMKPHVPGIVIFADHNRQLPWSVTYHAVTLFADVSGFTALCEKYSTMGQSGVDQLTRTLNEYISALVEGILGSDGDILKFAGDAILAIWRVGRLEELQSEIVKVLQCCMEMQEVCGEWNTDIGVKLTVKIGVAAGEMSVTFLGNSEYRHYVELGPAISAVNTAENFCQSGMVVVSPCTWDHCSKELFELESMEDEKHMRVLGVKSPKRASSHSLPTPNWHRLPTQGRRRSEDDKLDGIPEQFAAKSSTEKAQSRRNSLLSTSLASHNSDMKPPSIEITSEEDIDQKYDTVGNESPGPAMKATPIKNIVPTKIKIGTKFGKLRKLVETVTEMKLDVALRLYILSPVLKKIDDNQPLAYLSEMRQVSIVFMNLVLNADIEAELLLQKIFEVVYARTKSMHGALNKVFLFDKGCTFLVIFGLPGYKHEDDCVHALTCSEWMKSLLDKMEGVEHVSIGVTTGTTFCGVVGHSQRHEYSVIGRKVNMAARLMMHYPDKITCDEDTYQISRLPPTLFEVLITKRMKGLRNVGVIRQFTGYSKDEKLIARSIIHTDYPVLGRQMEDFMFREQLKLVRREENKRQHLVFSGPSGIGKTKVLDQALCIAVQENFKMLNWLKFGKVTAKAPPSILLPDPRECETNDEACGTSSANTSVNEVLSPTSSKRKRESYGRYSPEQRAKMARYCIDNGPAKAVL